MSCNLLKSFGFLAIVITVLLLFTTPVLAGDYTDPATLPEYSEVAEAPSVVSSPCDCSKEMKVVAEIVRNPVGPVLEEPASKAKTEWWQVLLDNILQLVFAVLGLVVIPLIQKGVALLNAKRNWHIQSEVLEGLALQGISYAEEFSRKSVIHNGGHKTPSAQKLDIALNFVKDQLKASGFEKDVKVDLTQFIESKLHHVRPMFQQINTDDQNFRASMAPNANGCSTNGCSTNGNSMEEVDNNSNGKTT